MIKHIINSYCMKGMTCQISRGSWSAGFKPPTRNSSARNTTSAQTHKLKQCAWRKRKLPPSLKICLLLFLWLRRPNIPGFQPQFIFLRCFKAALLLHFGLYMTLAYLLVWLFQTKINVLHSPLNQNKFNNYISLRRDNYPPMSQMNNFVCLTTKYKPQVLRDNPENQAEPWPLPQNKHLSKQMDLVLKIYNE